MRSWSPAAPISTSVPSTEDVAPAAEAIIWFIASRDGGELELGQLVGAPRSSGCSMPIIAAARRRAPSSVITNTLPPVTPST